MRTMRGAAATVARPGSSLSCILKEKGFTLSHARHTSLLHDQALLQASPVPRAEEKLPGSPCDFFLRMGPFPENGNCLVVWTVTLKGKFWNAISQGDYVAIILESIPPHSGEEGTSRW